jgi:two-component system, OmpR family, phosphate regulon sensor histidine kinase PhoR
VVGDIGQPAGADVPVADPTSADPGVDLLRRRLANVLGHALRTPVATVRGLVESIEPTGEDAVVHHEVLTTLHRSAARLEQLVDDLLLVSGLETGLPTGSPTELDPVQVAQQVTDDLDLPLDLDIGSANGTRVTARPDALRWILRCVLDNAARYGAARRSSTSNPTRTTCRCSSRPALAGSRPPTTTSRTRSKPSTAANVPSWWTARASASG